MDEVGHGRHAGGTANEDHVVQVALRETGILQGLLEGDPATLDEIGRHLLELGAAERLVEVEGTVGGGGDERQVDLGRLDLAQLDLGLLSGFSRRCIAMRSDDRSTPWAFLNC